ncbi:MAG: ATP-binding protein [Rhodospirillaceae bacterium]|nr:ATP-binding protein [Rhodospirillaceae bacterium]
MQALVAHQKQFVLGPEAVRVRPEWEALQLADRLPEGTRIVAIGNAPSALAAAPPGPYPVFASSSDPLGDLPVQVDRSEVDKLLSDTVATSALLAQNVAEFQRVRARQLYEEVQSLNEDRLLLLPHLSPQRRQAITGFGAVGIDQALSELRQVVLVLSYHAHSVSEWVRNGSWPGGSAGTATAVVLKVLLALAAFYWGRRLARTLLLSWRERVRENARRTRSLHVGSLDGVIVGLLRVVQPLSWLVLVLAINWILPPAISRLMEVQLVVEILKWSLGGWLAVVTLDNLAMRRALRIGGRGRISTDTVRLRSLRLLGFAVVIIGLILSLSRRMVGAGTVYSWVLHTCWWAALPIGLVIVHWWRDAIFERVGLLRRKSAFKSWVLANRKGWRGLFVATLAGAHLFTKGVVAVIKAWLGEFEITRRVLAYIFRQKLDRMAELQEPAALAPLPVEALAGLSPRTPSEELICGANDPKVTEILKHIDSTAGGVFAVVGERGSGRSTVLQRVSETRENVALVDCPFEGLDALTRALAQALNLPADGNLESLAAQLDSEERDLGLIIDNAHRLIHPTMGGLAAFDRLIDCARRHSRHCAWVMSMDRVVWRFYGAHAPRTCCSTRSWCSRTGPKKISPRC